MGTRMCLVGWIAAACLLSVGCTHTHLRRNTIRQVGTLDEIYTQQVMDNLAKFVYSSNSLPHFAIPKEGSTNVTDTGTLMGGIIGQKGAVSFFLQQLNLNGTASRKVQESWTLTPITDPHKLGLMRCAYQYAVASCGCGYPSYDCPNCEKMLEEFHAHEKSTDYKRTVDGKIVFHDFETAVSDCSCKTAFEAKREPVLETTDVGITENCVRGFSEYGWLGVGTKNDVPEDCDSVYVGHYCEQYVWVLPCHRDKLTQLTLAIMDYAIYEPPKTTTKEVTLYLTADGTSSTKADDRAQVVSALVPINTPQSKIREVLGIDPPKVEKTKDGIPYESQIRSFQLYPRTRTFHPSSGLLNLQQQLRTVPQ